MRKVMFAGLGSIGQRHLRNLRALLGDSVEVIAFRARGERTVLDGVGAQEGDVDSHYGIRSFANIDDALAEGPDVAFITNPTALHVSTAIRAAKAGCHLFIEKPLSNSMDGIDELEDVVRGSGIVAFVAYQFRFHPAFERMRRAVEGVSPAFVTAEVAEYMPGFHSYEDYRRTYAARRDLGGGVTLSQIHELDCLCGLFGRPTRAYSLGGKMSRLDTDVDDVSMSLLEFRVNGQDVPARLHQDFLRSPAKRGIEVIGDGEGGITRISWDIPSTLEVFRPSGLTERTFFPLERNQVYVEEMKSFLRCLRGAERPAVDIAEARKSLAAALAILESHKTRQPVIIR